ncbi:MAG: HD domain-containing protein [Burkholderiaceae bacterium]
MQLDGLNDLLSLYERNGALQYAGEPVNQIEHAWQSMVWAQNEGARASLQLAAFFHDLGHLFQREDGSPSLHGVDDKHEKIGSAVLKRVFGVAVSAPVSLHVDAKRYLVSVDPGYMRQLSEDSIRSLKLQGGPMTPAEQSQFKDSSFWAEAVQLRQWDEKSKEAERDIPSMDSITASLSALASRL